VFDGGIGQKTCQAKSQAGVLTGKLIATISDYHISEWHTL
jgi:hypothetical protein